MEIKIFKKTLVLFVLFLTIVTSKSFLLNAAEEQKTDENLQGGVTLLVDKLMEYVPRALEERSELKEAMNKRIYDFVVMANRADDFSSARIGEIERQGNDLAAWMHKTIWSNLTLDTTKKLFGDLLSLEHFPDLKSSAAYGGDVSKLISDYLLNLELPFVLYYIIPPAIMDKMNEYIQSTPIMQIWNTVVTRAALPCANLAGNLLGGAFYPLTKIYKKIQETRKSKVE